jgi:hypothetical protein
MVPYFGCNVERPCCTILITNAHPRSVNTRIAFATTKKNQSSVTDYFTKMLVFVDDLIASRTPLRDDEFIAYLLAGLDEEYNPMFTVIGALILLARSFHPIIASLTRLSTV